MKMSDAAVPDRRGGAGLSPEDCRCPVCLELFIEPVTLPCTHTFCKARRTNTHTHTPHNQPSSDCSGVLVLQGCFLEAVDKAALCCPLCRKRVSTWARQHSRSRTLVNQQLWSRIQERFPSLCQRRLSGQDGGPEEGLEGRGGPGERAGGAAALTCVCVCVGGQCPCVSPG